MGPLTARTPDRPSTVEEESADPIGSVTISAGLATGFLLGGVVMAVGVMRMDLRPGAILGAMSVLYLFGVMSGLLLGSLLAVLGRPDGVTRPEAMTRVRSALLMSVPLLALGWLVSAAMALTGVVLRSGPWPLLLLVAVSWGVAGVVGIWAAVAGTKALWNALVR